MYAENNKSLIFTNFYWSDKFKATLILTRPTKLNPEHAMNYLKIFAALFLTGTMLFSASSSYSAEIFSSPNEKLALGTELTLEDFKGQTFFASSLRKEGKGMEVRVVFDGDGNVQSIALQASVSPAKGKVK